MTDHLLPRAQITRAASLFGLATGPASRLHGGTANLSYLVGHDSLSVVTFCVGLGPARASSLARLLLHLGRHNFSTNRLITAMSGEHVATLDGVPIIAKSFIPGRALDGVDSTTAYSIGELLGKLHQVPPPADLPSWHAMVPARMRRLAHASPDPSFAEWLPSALDDCSTWPQALPVGLVHGDLFPDNLVLDPNGGLHAIDLEEACVHPLIFDIGMTLAGFAHVHALNDSTVLALLGGYECSRQLGASELRALPQAVAFGAVVTACWRVHAAQGRALAPLRDWTAMRAVAERALAWCRDGALPPVV